jgi:hypothetical protein
VQLPPRLVLLQLLMNLPLLTGAPGVPRQAAWADNDKVGRGVCGGGRGTCTATHEGYDRGTVLTGAPGAPKHAAWAGDGIGQGEGVWAA